jgi:hypothetical protein
VGPKAYNFQGPLYEKEYKSRYESEYLFRMTKGSTTKYKFKKADKCFKHHKIQKNYNIFIN